MKEESEAQRKSVPTPSLMGPRLWAVAKDRLVGDSGPRGRGACIYSPQSAMLERRGEDRKSNVLRKTMFLGDWGRVGLETGNQSQGCHAEVR